MLSMLRILKDILLQMSKGPSRIALLLRVVGLGLCTKDPTGRRYTVEFVPASADPFDKHKAGSLQHDQVSPDGACKGNGG